MHGDKVPAWQSLDAITIDTIAVVVTDEGLIEDSPNHLQVDFANCLIGGGVLGRVRLVVKLVLIIIRAHCKRKYDF
jgi:hypothetical protein